MKPRKTRSGTANEAARPRLDNFSGIEERTQAKCEVITEPEVGIFFVYHGTPFIQGTTVSEGEAYGNFRGHATGHPAFWQTLQRNGLVPSTVDYDEVPRGFAPLTF